MPTNLLGQKTYILGQKMYIEGRTHHHLYTFHKENVTDITMLVKESEVESGKTLADQGYGRRTVAIPMPSHKNGIEAAKEIFVYVDGKQHNNIQDARELYKHLVTLGFTPYDHYSMALERRNTQ